ncbi:MAG: glycerol-3-phosphate 1-O-acyltransferase PlsY [Clostridia bacterium]|nr:glycerol-3-phosphate 1-O-acyltransferase PlsY [Clostridia bacterium]
MKYVIWIAIAVGAYFLGNFSTGLIVGKTFGNIDIRKTGSGNAGTTNIMRTLGWLPSVLTLVGDTLKAFIAVKLGKWLGGDIGGYIAGIAVLLGHNWPVLLNFKGGKGMASSLGIIFANEPWLAVALLVIQIVIVGLTRYMSVASICTAILYAVAVAVFHPGNTGYIIFAIIMCALALFCHRENIKRLLSGTENRLDFSKISKLSAKLRQKK